MFDQHEIEGSTADIDCRNQAPIAVGRLGVEIHDLAKRMLGQELLGLLRERLAPLRSVDTMQTDSELPHLPWTVRVTSIVSPSRMPTTLPWLGLAANTGCMAVSIKETAMYLSTRMPLRLA